MAFKNNKRGAAALELGLLLPLLTGAFIATIDIGQAITMRQEVSKRMRLGIEGAMRFPHDTSAAMTFANARPGGEITGGQTIDGGISVTITADYRCRETDGTATPVAPGETSGCGDLETWYRIEATGSHEGLFGREIAPASVAKVLIE